MVDGLYLNILAISYAIPLDSNITPQLRLGFFPLKLIPLVAKSANKEIRCQVSALFWNCSVSVVLTMAVEEAKQSCAGH